MSAHAAFGVDEQLSLTAATEGRTMGFDRKWNLFPKQDIVDGEIPDGVVHWLGWPKPWHQGAQVWRPDIWESEKSSWEHLRMGLWEKPLSVELEPDGYRDVRALARRGWKVKVFSTRFSPNADAYPGGSEPMFPDVETHGASRQEFQQWLETESGLVDQVRIGSWEDPADWLDDSRVVPEHLVLRGGIDAEVADRLRALGYTEEAKLMSGEWPEGGPLPRMLSYHPCRPGTATGPGEDLYLRRSDHIMKSDRQLSLSRKPEQVRLIDAKRIGLCVIATADFRMNIRPLLRSVRQNFLPGHEVTVFLFTDGDMKPQPDLQVIPVEHSVWPGMAIRRYSLIRTHAAVFAGMEYLFLLDANMRICSPVGEEILADLVATLHPGFHDKPRKKFTYERREQSTARVSPGEGTHYFCGGFQGGKTECFLEAASIMAERIAVDEARGITAVWHDESHWNRYLIDHQPSLILSPAYCWHPDERLKEFFGKISVLPNDSAVMRGESSYLAKPANR